MATRTNKAKQSSRKKTAKTARKKTGPLAMCPTGAAGWCAYPFSVAQLEKRLKEKAARALELEPVAEPLATRG